jgi:hypothetical protein
MTFNLHGVVRGAIQTVNADVDGTVYVSTGRTAVRGILTATFAAVAARLQVQAQKHDPLRHQNGLEYSNSYLTIYAYGNFSDLERPAGTGGDVVQFARTTDQAERWYYISQVLEWWPGWCCFEVTRQLNAADIATLVAQLQNGANP